jgi:hypothetical protein
MPPSFSAEWRSKIPATLQPYPSANPPPESLSTVRYQGLLRAVVLSMSTCLSWSDVVRRNGIEPVHTVTCPRANSSLHDASDSQGRRGGCSRLGTTQTPSPGGVGAWDVGCFSSSCSSAVPNHCVTVSILSSENAGLAASWRKARCNPECQAGCAQEDVRASRWPSDREACR